MLKYLKIFISLYQNYLNHYLTKLLKIIINNFTFNRSIIVASLIFNVVNTNFLEILNHYSKLIYIMIIIYL